MIVCLLGASGQRLVLSDEVITHIEAHRQLKPTQREAGGQLFARFDGTDTVIVRATGPRQSDQRSWYSFVPNRFAERREIRKMFKSGLHYVGDWHTHPERHPSPSPTDIASFQDMFRKSRHQLSNFVMFIAGTAEGNDGLYIALVDATSVNRVYPTTD